jgi:DUF4097 and DUF4098 domain-containing protein YvlB
MPSKTLTIEVPASLIGSLSKLEIDTVSAGIDVSGVYGTQTDLETVSGGIDCADIAVDKLDLSSTSGSIACENTRARKLDLDNVSGSIRAEGEFEEIDSESVSGSTRLSCATAPSKIDVDGVSGSITVSLPDSAEFHRKARFRQRVDQLRFSRHAWSGHGRGRGRQRELPLQHGQRQPSY